jgi:hypothetical protein
MPNRKPNTLDGIFYYSVVSGLLLAVLIHTGKDVSETGVLLTILKTISGTLDSPSPYIVPAVSILTTILEGIIILRYVGQIVENRIQGILVSGGGFFGSLSVFLGSVANIQPVIYLGVALWVLGSITPRFSE